MFICQNVRDHIYVCISTVAEGGVYLSNIYNSGITRSCSTTQSPSLLPASHTRHLSNHDHDGDDDSDEDGDDGGDDGDDDGGDDSDDDGGDDGGDYSDDNFEDQGLLW